MAKLELAAPLYISPRLMAAIDVDGSTVHIYPDHVDDEGRTFWRWVIVDDEGAQLEEGADLGTPVGRETDAREAMATLLDFLYAAAERYRRNGYAPETVEPLFNAEVQEWAYMNEDTLSILAIVLQETED